MSTTTPTTPDEQATITPDADDTATLAVEDMRATLFPFGTDRDPVGPVVRVTEDTPDGAAYADEVRTFVSRFWAAPSAASLDFLVMWIVGTHLRGRNAAPFLPEAWPLLMLGSTGPASGKTTALRMVAELSARGKMLAEVTAPAAVNAVEGAQNTLCLDEFDTMLGQGAGSKNLRAHLLASYSTGGMISKATGGQTRDIDVHYPVAFAGMIRTFMTHPTLSALRTRTHVLHCRPAEQGPDAPTVERFRARHRTHAAALREVLSAWGLSEAPRVVTTAEHIDLPDGVHNRDAELWEPLFALAECLGGDWPARCYAACLEITRGTPGEDDAPKSPVEWLLRDLAHVWTPGAVRMSSADVVSGLLGLPESPWARWLDADPRNPAVSGGKHLAKMLADRNGADGKPLRPRPLKLNGTTVRGFDLADMVAAGMVAPVTPVADEDMAATTPMDEDTGAPVTAAGRPRKPRKRNPSPKRAPGGPQTPVTGDGSS